MSESRLARRGIAGVLGVVALLAAAPSLAEAAQFDENVISIPIGGTPNSIADGDFNGDGDPEIVAGRYSAASVAVSLGEPGFDFGAVDIYPAGGNPDALGSADLNGDGDPELVVGNRNSDNVSVLLGGPGIGFTAGPGPFPAGNGPQDLVLADFDGDSNPDLAVPDFFSAAGDVSILLGTGGGSFGAPTAVQTGAPAANGIATGDFNRDGDVDLAVSSGITVFPDSGRVVIFLGGPGASFAAPAIHPFAQVPRDIVLGDFNGDGRDDIAAPGSGVLYVLTGNADGTFTPTPEIEKPSLGIGIASADFNADNDPDLVFATGDVEVGVMMGGPGASFGPPEFLAAGFENFAVVTGDYTEDGRPDFAVVNQGEDNAFVYRNTGETAGPPPGAEAKCLGKTADIVGTDSDDVLRGTNKADVIAGLDGDDVLKGRGGKDRLCGGGDKDKLIGGPARDRCAGGPAKDTERSCP
jgi:hypothetical protein